MKFLSSKRNNIILTILLSIICILVIIYSEVPEGAGMATIIMVWLPAIIWIFTIVAYLIGNMISKKYAPIVTILGNLFNILIVASALWS